MDQVVTTTPTALSGINTGTRYSIQNQGVNDVLIVAGTSAPAATARGWIIGRYSGTVFNAVIATAETSESLYVWCRDGTSRVYYEEAA